MKRIIKWDTQKEMAGPQFVLLPHCAARCIAWRCFLRVASESGSELIMRPDGGHNHAPLRHGCVWQADTVLAHRNKLNTEHGMQVCVFLRRFITGMQGSGRLCPIRPIGNINSMRLSDVLQWIVICTRCRSLYTGWICSFERKCVCSVPGESDWERLWLRGFKPDATISLWGCEAEQDGQGTDANATRSYVVLQRFIIILDKDWVIRLRGLKIWLCRKNSWWKKIFFSVFFP